MSKDEIIQETKRFVEERLRDESSGHDWWHVSRVWRSAMIIGAREGADIFVVQLAALLHDISDYKLNGGDKEAGPWIAARWLKKLGVPDDDVAHVSRIIRSIGFERDRLINDDLSLEGKVVQDADRLDAIGAIGIARAFAFGGYTNKPIFRPESNGEDGDRGGKEDSPSGSSVGHFYDKLLFLKGALHTETAKHVAETRHRVLEKYLQEFFREWNGEDIL